MLAVPDGNQGLVVYNDARGARLGAMLMKNGKNAKNIIHSFVLFVKDTMLIEHEY